MMFFLGLLVGTTAGFFCAAMAQSASADAEFREIDQLPQVSIHIQESPMNTGRYAIINESAANSAPDTRTGTEG